MNKIGRIDTIANKYRCYKLLKDNGLTVPLWACEIHVVKAEQKHDGYERICEFRLIIPYRCIVYFDNIDFFKNTTSIYIENPQPTHQYKHSGPISDIVENLTQLFWLDRMETTTVHTKNLPSPESIVGQRLNNINPMTKYSNHYQFVYINGEMCPYAGRKTSAQVELEYMAWLWDHFKTAENSRAYIRELAYPDGGHEGPNPGFLMIRFKFPSIEGYFILTYIDSELYRLEHKDYEFVDSLQNLDRHLSEYVGKIKGYDKQRSDLESTLFKS